MAKKMERVYERGLKQISMVSISSHRAEKGKGMHKATGIVAMDPKWLHPDKAS